MSGFAAPYTASDLHERSRALHRPRVLLANPGWVCVGAALLLSLLGALAIATTEPGYAQRHLVHLAVALLGAACVTVPHFRRLRDLSWPFTILVLGLLLFLLVPSVPEVLVRPRNGARRWINLVVIDFQPSELAKIAYVVVLAGYLRYRSSYRRLRGLLVPLALTFVPVGLILVEPDLGTAMLFLPALFAILVAAGARLKHLVLVAAIGVAAAPTMYPLLRAHQKARIRAMAAQLVGDDSYRRDIGFQGAQARTLIGAGGLLGTGREHAAELIRFNHLPEEHNDMIFAVVCCRWGFAGAALLWALFAAFGAGAMLVAAQAKDPFARLVAVGLVTMIVAQMVVNTGMTLGLLPITGMTLPFVSAGGSSLVATWLMVGLLLNLGLRRPPYMTRESFDFDGGDEA